MLKHYTEVGMSEWMLGLAMWEKKSQNHMLIENSIWRCHLSLKA